MLTTRLRCSPRDSENFHGLERRRADGPDRADQHPRRFDLRAAAGGAEARPRAQLLHARPAGDGAGPGVRHRAAAAGARRGGQPFHAGRSQAHRAVGVRRDADAAGPAVRSRLHHGDASARAHPSEDAGGQRPGAGAQRAGEDVRDAVSGADAADADHPRPRRDQGVPRRARRHRDEAAVRPRRRRGVPPRPRTTSTSARSTTCSRRPSASRG